MIENHRLSTWEGPSGVTPWNSVHKSCVRFPSECKRKLHLSRKPLPFFTDSISMNFPPKSAYCTFSSKFDSIKLRFQIHEPYGWGTWAESRLRARPQAAMGPWAKRWAQWWFKWPATALQERSSLLSDFLMRSQKSEFLVTISWLLNI